MNGLEVLGSFKVLLRQVEAQRQVIPVVTVKYLAFVITTKGDHMAYTLPVDHQVDVQVAYVDSKGNVATVDGAPVWSSSDETLVTVTANAEDAFKATVKPVGPAGNVQVNVKVDADLGEGVRELITLMDVTLVAGEAVTGTITPVGAPTPQV